MLMLPVTFIQRGIHDVNEEIVHPSRPAFIFHDSGGFEAGSEKEMELLRTFIATRCGAEDINEQLHIIWFCISADDERPLQGAEQRFFEMDTGKVPVIAVFTKCDALESKAYSKLRNDDGLSEADAEAAMANEANKTFERYFLPRLKEVQKRPVHHVRLRDLDMSEGSIADLVDRTAAAVGNQQGQRKLFILAHQYDLKLRPEYGIFEVIEAGSKTPDDIVRDCLTWLPHVWCPEVSMRLFQKLEGKWILI
jgi:hypothetical protein